MQDQLAPLVRPDLRAMLADRGQTARRATPEMQALRDCLVRLDLLVSGDPKDLKAIREARERLVFLERKAILARMVPRVTLALPAPPAPRSA